MKRATFLALALGCALPVSAQIGNRKPSSINDMDAVRAIIGEGSSQSDAALQGIASAIHNRGTLRGVYGLSNPVVDRATGALWARAARAWNLAKAGGDPENIRGCKFFGCPTDAPYFHQHGFKPVKTIGQITFYKPEPYLPTRPGIDP